MDATATPRGISLAVGELGARGRPINKQCTAVRISSTVNGDMCGTCLPSALIVCPCERRSQPTALVSFRVLCARFGAPGEPRSSWRAPGGIGA